MISSVTVAEVVDVVVDKVVVVGSNWNTIIKIQSNLDKAKDTTNKIEHFFWITKHNTYNTIWNTTYTNYNAYLHYSTYSH